MKREHERGIAKMVENEFRLFNFDESPRVIFEGEKFAFENFLSLLVGLFGPSMLLSCC